VVATQSAAQLDAELEAADASAGIVRDEKQTADA
jgi:large subunit ribosomal protein L25